MQERLPWPPRLTPSIFNWWIIIYGGIAQMFLFPNMSRNSRVVHFLTEDTAIFRQGYIINPIEFFPVAPNLAKQQINEAILLRGFLRRDEYVNQV
jgi:hypothetical protein